MTSFPSGQSNRQRWFRWFFFSRWPLNCTDYMAKLQGMMKWQQCHNFKGRARL